MNREEIINTSSCPKCEAPVGQPCKRPAKDGNKNHVERLYRAQDAAAGKPDRTTGEANFDHLADRRCPICHKALKTPQGKNDHMMGVHKMTRAEARAASRAYRQQSDPQHHLKSQSTRPPADDDDFDVIE